MIKRPLIWILGGWILGEIVAGWLGIMVDPPTTLDQVMDGQESLRVTVTGSVRAVQKTDYGIRLRITDNEVLWEEKCLETHDLLLKGGSGGSAASLLSSLEPGSRIRVSGLLSPFHIPGNPGEFHQQEYYRIQGVDYQLTPDTLEVVEEGGFGLQQWSEWLREQLKQSIRQVTTDAEMCSLFLALVIGDRSELSEETRELYQIGGIMHLLAISALHLSLLGMGLWKGLRRIGVPLLPAGLAAAGFLLWYVWFTGGSASGWRAFLMFVVMLGAAIIGRTYDLLSALGLAGLLILWEQPLYAWQAGFQLSFAAMAGIGILYPAAAGWCGVGREPQALPGATLIQRVGQAFWRMARRALLFSACVQLATLPVLAWHYHEISVYGVFLNLLAVPLMSYAMLSVMFSSLLGLFFPSVGHLVAGTAELIFQFYHVLCLLVSGLPMAQWMTGRPTVGQVIFWLVLLTVLLLLWNRERLRCKKSPQNAPASSRRFPRTGKVPMLVFLYVLGILLLSPLPRADLKLTILDVGQGDCNVVQLPDGGACLVDGGSSSVSRVGEQRILPYLKYEGISRVEMIFLSHSDEDHINGIAEVIQDPAITVHGLAISAASAADAAWDELLALARIWQIPVYELKTGDVVQCGEVQFSCLFPAAHASTTESNELSLVLELQYRGFTGLLTGDISREVEETISLSRDITWLKVAHHGSRYSTGESFLSVAAPMIATISCGEKNRYGHPHEETLLRLRESGASIHITPACGAIMISVEEERIQGRCYLSGESWQIKRNTSAQK